MVFSINGVGPNGYPYGRTTLTTTSHYTEGTIPDRTPIYLNGKNKISKVLEEN